MSRRRQKKPRGQRAGKAKRKSGFLLADESSKAGPATETSSLALAGAGWPIAPPSEGRRKREPITIQLASALYVRAKKVVQATPELTLGSLAVEALQTHLDKLETQLNDSLPAPRNATESDESKK